METIKEMYGIESKKECRLRNLYHNRFYHQEEMDAQLKAYQDFIDGGARIQLEDGRPTTMAEINVSVFLFKEEEDVRQYYFNADIQLKEAKKIICQDFAGHDGTKDISPDKFTLYRTDNFNEPSFPVRRMNVTFKSNKVFSGDLLVLRGNKDCDPSDVMKLSVHLTNTGLSDDSKYLQDVEVMKEMTLDDLKEQLMDLPALHPLTSHLQNPNFLRVREKTYNGFFGRIFREPKKTLK